VLRKGSRKNAAAWPKTGGKGQGANLKGTSIGFIKNRYSMLNC